MRLWAYSMPFTLAWETTMALGLAGPMNINDHSVDYIHRKNLVNTWKFAMEIKGKESHLFTCIVWRLSFFHQISAKPSDQNIHTPV